MSPFKALYGRDPPPLIFAPPSDTTPPAAAELIRQRGELLVELRRNLERAQQRMRESANKHRRHVEFKVGDKVLLKLQPYRQHSVARPLSAKLARRFYGPFEVIARIGPVAYRLRLPEGSRIHNVFHVGLLRPFVVGADEEPIISFPAEFLGDRPVVYPVRVLDSRVLWHEGEPKEHVLVRWSDGSDSPTWEPLDMIRRRYPNVLLEDKEVAIGEGVDTSQPQQAATAHPTTPQGVTELEEEEGEMPIETEPEQAAAATVETSIAKSKPKRDARPPNRFGDYVPK